MIDWNRIKAHYAEAAPQIMGEQRCEWGIDAYAWEEAGIRLTPIEAWLWSDIRQANAIFYPQYPVGRFFVDFANPVAKVAIECDGFAFHLDKAKDRARDDELEAMGWTVYRITGAECAKDSDEETGEPSYAARFVRDITERHRIGRHHRTTNKPFRTGSFAKASA